MTGTPDLQLVDGSLTLEVAPWTVQALARAELRDRVQALRLWSRGMVEAKALVALAKLPLPALERVTLVGDNFDDEALRALSRFDAANRLRGLRLEGFWIDPDAIKTLTAPAHLGWIRDLEIS